MFLKRYLRKVFKIGHSTDLVKATGCTVIICLEKTVGGISIQGGATCTRETDLLNSLSLRSEVNAVLLTGGSVFGLSTAEGVISFLQEKNGTRKIPIVPTLSLFDLRIGKAEAPGPEQGYEACLNANKSELLKGNVGAGTGATVGKIRGIKWATKGGLGHSSFKFKNDVFVRALVAVNAFGDIIDDKTGQIIAGARTRTGFLNTIKFIEEKGMKYLDYRENTTLGVVMTNAKLNKAEINKVAQMAQAGFTRVIKPCWTVNDGDIIIALSSGKRQCDFNLIGIIAAEVVKNAIIDAIKSAKSIYGIISFSDFFKRWKL
jgi:L-aminopeptidase/D-esterase-like protein